MAKVENDLDIYYAVGNANTQRQENELAAIMKKHPSSSTTAATFSVSFPNRTLGQIKISLSDSITRNLKSGRYGYDLLIQDSSGLRTRVIEGSALVTAGNTTSI